MKKFYYKSSLTLSNEVTDISNIELSYDKSESSIDKSELSADNSKSESSIDKSELSADNSKSEVSADNSKSEVSADNSESGVSADNSKSGVSADNSESGVSADNSNSKSGVSDNNSKTKVSADNSNLKLEISDDNSKSEVSADNSNLKLEISDDNSKSEVSSDNSIINIKILKKRGRKPKIKPNVELEIKIPKKRGRKPKIKTDPPEIKIPKKRGRKPKPKLENESVKVSKKRGRSYKQKTYELANNISKIESKNIILHLPIKSKHIIQTSKEIELLTYTPDIQEPVGWQDIIGGNPIDSVAFLHKNSITSKELPFYSQYPFDEKNMSDILEESVDLSVNSQTNTDQDNSLLETINSSNSPPKDNPPESINNIESEHNNQWYNNSSNKYDTYQNVINIMKENREKELDNLKNKKTIPYSENILIQFDNSKSSTWLSSTSIYCWWCCHPFSCAPCAIPYEYNDSKFKVYGVFCSPECVAAYIFDNYNNETVWEKYSLLNFMYNKLYNQKNLKIKLAAPRQTLKIFGGNLNIKHFREYNINYKKNFNVIIPPLVSIIPQVEYNFSNNGYKTSSDKKNFNIDKNKLNNDELLIKRSKPIVDYNNTLEKCMKLSFNT